MKKKHITNSIPSLTIDGKRLIIKEVCKRIGEKKLTRWLNSKGVISVSYLNENVRKYKAKFFRELAELS